MRPDEIIQVLAILTSLITIITTLLSFINQSNTPNERKRMYQIGNEKNILLPLVSFIKCILIIAIFSFFTIVIITFDIIPEHFFVLNITTIIGYIIIITRSTKRLKSHKLKLDIDLQNLQNSKIKMFYNSILLSLIIVYGFYYLLIINEPIIGWLYVGSLPFTLLTHLSLFIKYDKKEYQHFNYEINLINGEKLPCLYLYETDSTYILKSKWTNGNDRTNYIELNKKYVSVVKTKLEYINIKNHLKKSRL